jgi:hypothetical protein
VIGDLGDPLERPDAWKPATDDPRIERGNQESGNGAFNCRILAR